MRLIHARRRWAAILLLAAPLHAQEPADVQELRRALADTTARFQLELDRQRQANEELTRRLQAMEARLNALTAQPTGAPPAAPTAPPGPPTPGTVASPSTPAATPTTATATSQPAASAAVPSAAWKPSDPLRLGSGRSYVDLGLTGTIAVGGSTADDIEGGLEPGGHDPNQRGFTVQGIELNLSGAVDPFFRANANLNFGLDADGESTLELEEAWAETAALPAGFQVRAGQMFSEFGRHNPTHLHAWGFVDTPLVNGRLLGPDGLRNPGARVSWLAPTPFYAQLLLGLQNSQGGTASGFRDGGGHAHGDEAALPLAYRHADNDRGVTGLGDLLLTPRYEMSWDITHDIALLFGGSAALGPNSRGGDDAGDTTTQIYGLDLTWKWKSPHQQGGFPFVAWQTEGLWRQYDAGRFDWADEAAGGTTTDVVLDAATGQPAALEGETLTDYGFYTQVLWGFRRGWVAGLRLDGLWGDVAAYERRALTFNGEALGRDPQRDDRWRLSPNLTWYPSEFSRVRLQYNYDDRDDIGVDHSVWLQLEFSLGAHAAHKF